MEVNWTHVKMDAFPTEILFNILTVYHNYVLQPRSLILVCKRTHGFINQYFTLFDCTKESRTEYVTFVKRFISFTSDAQIKSVLFLSAILDLDRHTVSNSAVDIKKLITQHGEYTRQMYTAEKTNVYFISYVKVDLLVAFMTMQIAIDITRNDPATTLIWPSDVYYQSRLLETICAILRYGRAIFNYNISYDCNYNSVNSLSKFFIDVVNTFDIMFSNDNQLYWKINLDEQIIPSVGGIDNRIRISLIRMRRPTEQISKSS